MRPEDKFRILSRQPQTSQRFFKVNKAFIIVEKVWKLHRLPYFDRLANFRVGMGRESIVLIFLVGEHVVVGGALVEDAV